MIMMMEPNSGKDHLRDGQNVGGALYNSAQKNKLTLGQEASSSRYQPTTEPNQQARMSSLRKSPEFQQMVSFIQGRENGGPDNVNGATNFLAKNMKDYWKSDPNKYPIEHWGKWSGYDPATDTFKYDTHVPDSSHVFIREPGDPDPKGGFAPATQTAANDVPPGASPAMIHNYGRLSGPDAPSAPDVAVADATPSSPPPPPSDASPVGGFLKGVGAGISDFGNGFTAQSNQSGRDLAKTSAEGLQRLQALNAQANQMNDPSRNAMAYLSLIQGMRA
jgi:hypothetical protein